MTSFGGKRPGRKLSSARVLQLLSVALFVLIGCAAESSPTVVGSNHVASREVAISVVQNMIVSVPFQVRVYDGEPGVITFHGEDNLIAMIHVEQITASHYKIAAPWDMKFEQHAPVDISIPFVDMVRIEYNGDAKPMDGATP